MTLGNKVILYIVLYPQKREKFKKWLKNRTEENFVSMKSAKIQCNRVIAEAKRS